MTKVTNKERHKEPTIFQSTKRTQGTHKFFAGTKTPETKKNIAHVTRPQLNTFSYYTSTTTQGGLLYARRRCQRRVSQLSQNTFATRVSVLVVSSPRLPFPALRLSPLSDERALSCGFERRRSGAEAVALRKR